MRSLILILSLSLFSLAVHADEENPCTVSARVGHISIDPTRFKVSPVEERLIQTPTIVATRTVHSSTNAEQFSLGCMVTEHWGIDLLAVRGAKFSIENTIATPQLPSFAAGHNLPVIPISATVMRKAEMNTAYGVMVSYAFPVTETIKIRPAIGAYHVSIDETSWIAVNDMNGNNITVAGPSEKKSGSIPVAAIGVEAKIYHNLDLALQAYLPGKGVHASFVGLSWSF